MTAADRQIGHWQRKPRRGETLLAFIRKWYKETGTYPSMEWLRLVFGADYFDTRRTMTSEIAGSIALPQAVTG